MPVRPRRAKSQSVAESAGPEVAEQQQRDRTRSGQANLPSRRLLTLLIYLFINSFVLYGRKPLIMPWLP